MCENQLFSNQTEWFSFLWQLLNTYRISWRFNRFSVDSMHPVCKVWQNLTSRGIFNGVNQRAVPISKLPDRWSGGTQLCVRDWYSTKQYACSTVVLKRLFFLYSRAYLKRIWGATRRTQCTCDLEVLRWKRESNLWVLMLLSETEIFMDHPPNPSDANVEKVS